MNSPNISLPRNINYIHLNDLEDYKVLDLSQSTLYRDWLSRVIYALKRGFSDGLIGETTYRHHIGIANGPSSVYRLKGSAILLSYIWTNKEPKLLPIWLENNFITGTDAFWIEKYPFLLVDHDSIHQRIINIKRNIFNPLVLAQEEWCQNLLVSDNNHFGHFCLDSLPLIALESYLPSTQSSCKNNALPFRYKQGIIEVAKVLIKYACKLPGSNMRDIEFGDKNPLPDSISTYTKIENLVQYHQSNTFVGYYLLRKYLTACQDVLLQESQSQSINQDHIFLMRTGNYRSRIDNIDEVTLLLEKHRFTIIDPSSLTFLELFSILWNSKIIVSEGGSTLLNAGLFSNDSTRIIALLPKRLLSKADFSMLISGHPYFMPFFDRMSIVSGKSTQISIVQSSDIAVYSIDLLNQKLSAIF